MYRITVSILIFIFGFASLANGQNQTNKDSTTYLPVQYRFNIPGNFSFVTSDEVGNIYAITTSGRFIKYNANGDSLSAYNEVVRFGKPVRADVSNPFKILLIYQRIPSITLLDRQLSFQGNIPFRQKGLINANVVASSYDNKIWLFNQQLFSVQKYDDAFTLLQESNDVRQLSGDAIVPEKIIDANNQVVLYDSQHGFYVFDYYGNYQTKLPFLNWKDVAVFENKFVGRINDTLHVYDRAQFFEQSLLLPVKSKITTVYLRREKLFIVDGEGIRVYDIKQSIF
jgi:hypothetical protein